MFYFPKPIQHTESRQVQIGLGPVSTLQLKLNALSSNVLLDSGLMW